MLLYLHWSASQGSNCSQCLWNLDYCEQISTRHSFISFNLLATILPTSIFPWPRHQYMRMVTYRNTLLVERVLLLCMKKKFWKRRKYRYTTLVLLQIMIQRTSVTQQIAKPGESDMFEPKLLLPEPVDRLMQIYFFIVHCDTEIMEDLYARRASIFNIRMIVL
jgi:hypothetical protein